jgi:hypothetical protein
LNSKGWRGRQLQKFDLPWLHHVERRVTPARFSLGEMLASLALGDGGHRAIEDSNEYLVSVEKFSF